MEIYCNRNGFDESDKGSDRSSILSCEDNRLYFLYGDITTKNCASIAYDITKINFEDNEKEKKKEILSVSQYIFILILMEVQCMQCGC